MLIVGKADQTKEMDKTSLALSTGALALSLTFLHDIAPDPIPWTLRILAASWIMLVVSMLATSFSFYFSQLAYSLEIKKWDDNYTDTKAYESMNCWTQMISCLNLLALIFLATGVGLLAWFALVNVWK